MLTLYAIFPNPDAGVRCVGALLDLGATPECLSLVMKEQAQSGSSPDNLVEQAEHSVTTTTQADASAGAAKGAGVGLGLGILAALVSLIIPGFGLVIGGGALATAAAAAVGTTVAGAVAGGVTGYLVDQGVPEKTAAAYHEEVAAGRALLAINLPCQALDRLTIQEVLEKYGALNMGSYGSSEAAREAAAVELSEQPALVDAEFERHFQATLISTGLTYKDFEPAYRYGYGLKSLFAGDTWNEVEPAVHADWEQLHPGTWGRMKASIRHGWEHYQANVTRPSNIR